jgi:hypothetical protein
MNPQQGWPPGYGPNEQQQHVQQTQTVYYTPQPVQVTTQTYQPQPVQTTYTMAYSGTSQPYAVQQQVTPGYPPNYTQQTTWTGTQYAQDPSASYSYQQGAQQSVATTSVAPTANPFLSAGANPYATVDSGAQSVGSPAPQVRFPPTMLFPRSKLLFCMGNIYILVKDFQGTDFKITQRANFSFFSSDRPPSRPSNFFGLFTGKTNRKFVPSTLVHRPATIYASRVSGGPSRCVKKQSSVVASHNFPARLRLSFRFFRARCRSPTKIIVPITPIPSQHAFHTLFHRSFSNLTPFFRLGFFF